MFVDADVVSGRNDFARRCNSDLYSVLAQDRQNLSCIYKYAAIYGNVGYMALPLAEAELGAEGVFFCSGVLIPFNIFAFTHGIYLMSGESAKKPASIRNG